jgi:hypothetical protein
MKITIKNKNSALLSYLFNVKKLLIAFVIFFITLIGVGIASSSMPSIDGFLGWLISLFIPILYLFYHLMDGKKYIDKTYLESKDNGVEIHSGNIFNNTNISSLYSQISNMGVFQDWKYKLFGISQISITQTDGVQFSVWGFDPGEAQEFINQVSGKFQIKVNTE